MPEHTPIELTFPLGGVHRGRSFREQPPNTALDALNVRPEGPFERRDRGGSRPPLSHKYTGLGGTAIGANTVAGAPTYTSATGTSTVEADTIAVTNITASVYQGDNTTKITSAGTEFVTTVVGSTLIETSSGDEFIIVVRANTNIVYVRGDASSVSGAASVRPFTSSMVNGWVRFPSGRSYQITSYTDNDTVVVRGNAEDEATGVLTITNEAVNLLSSVRRALDSSATGGTRFWEDRFTEYGWGLISVTNGWSIPSWSGTSTGYYTQAAGQGRIAFGTALIPTATWSIMQRDVFNPLPAIDKNQAVEIDIQTLGFTAASKDFLVTVFFRLNDGTPDGTSDGVEATVRFEWGATSKIRGTAEQFANGASAEVVAQAGASGYPYTTGDSRGVLRIEYQSTDQAVVMYYNNQVFWGGVFAADLSGSDAGTRIAVGFQWDGAGDEPATATAWTHDISYTYTAEDTVAIGENRNQLVAAAGGLLYTNAADENTLAPLSTSLTLAADRSLRAAEHLQKLYIADTSKLLASGSSATSTCVVTTGDVLQDSTYDSADPDWTELGINANDHVVIISSIATGGNEGVYPISSIAAGGVTLGTRSDSTEANPTGGSLDATYRIVRGVKIYDPTAGTLTLAEETAGTGFPQNCHSVVMFQDRVFWAGDLSAPHRWYASARGDGTDYLYVGDPDNPGDAISDQAGDVGGIGDDITALVVASSDYLVFGGRKSVWVMRGDPGRGGVFDNLSRTIGIVGPQAFCVTPEGGVVFMSQDGIAHLPPSISGTPELISRDSLPAEMIGIDSQLTECVMEFDTEFRGVHIYLSPRYESGSNWATTPKATHFWLSWEHKSYWPVRIPDAVNPLTSISYSPATSGRDIVMLGARNGAVLRYKWGGYDVESQLDSHIILGPVAISSATRQGILAMFEAETATDSGGVQWELYVGKTAQLTADAAIEGASPRDSGSLDAGLSYKSYPRLAGGFACIKLYKTAIGGARPNWALETVNLGIAQGGMRRA